MSTKLAVNRVLRGTDVGTISEVSSPAVPSISILTDATPSSNKTLRRSPRSLKSKSDSTHGVCPRLGSPKNKRSTGAGNRSTKPKSSATVSATPAVDHSAIQLSKHIQPDHRHKIPTISNTKDLASVAMKIESGSANVPSALCFSHGNGADSALVEVCDGNLISEASDKTLDKPKKKRSKPRPKRNFQVPLENAVPRYQRPLLKAPSLASIKEDLLRPRNLLKLAKARRWIYCEFFYSDIDRELFLPSSCENEFTSCLRETFPDLRATRFSRTQWRWIRRMVGKPRRCSHAFFAEEREALERRREKIREIYRGSRVSLDSEEESLEMPPRLRDVIRPGTRVITRLRQGPRDGLFVGTVKMVLDCDRYTVMFEKEGHLPMIVSDLDISSQTPGPLLPLSYFFERNLAMKAKPLVGGAVGYLDGSVANQKVANEPANRRSSLLSSSQLIGGGSDLSTNPATTGVALSNQCARSFGEISAHTEWNGNGSTGLAAGVSGNAKLGVLQSPVYRLDDKNYLGNFPTKFLVLIVKLNKLLILKRRYIENLKDLNSEAERLNIFSNHYPAALQARYAEILLDLESINAQMTFYLNSVGRYTTWLVPNLTDVTVACRPDSLKKLSFAQAARIVHQANAETPPNSNHIDPLAFPKVHSSSSSGPFPEQIQHLTDSSSPVWDVGGQNFSTRISNMSNLGPCVRSPRALELLSQLVSLLLQTKSLSLEPTNPFELNTLSETLAEIGRGIDPSNRTIFQDNIEVPFSQLSEALVHRKSKISTANGE